MKVSSLWRTLTREQRRAWNAWAKNNKVLLDDGSRRRVSGRKAMTMVVRNRTIAGEAANPSVVPAVVAWLDGALDLSDAGPFTENAGFIGFRAQQNLAAGTKWFVWATPPVGGDVVNPRPMLRFVTCLALGAIAFEDLVYLNAPYLAVNGSWDGPLTEGEWPTPTFVWFRVHQYANGQLSPGVTLSGQIAIEL
ncbi:MAG: hypothetical protein KIS67_08355 [Verrucomicrobiae bacterium]|nr:hypothetical protein [Verrucomicrobiae bacterium]